MRNIFYERSSDRRISILLLPITILLIGLLLLTSTVVGQGSPWLMKDGNCEDMDSSGNVLRYYACVGEPLSILRTNISTFNLTVEPTNSTCGDTKQQSCTIVSNSLLSC